MDHNPPTTADYAYSNAQDAQAENRRLAARLEISERTIEALIAVCSETLMLVEPLHRRMALSLKLGDAAKVFKAMRHPPRKKQREPEPYFQGFMNAYRKAFGDRNPYDYDKGRR